GFSTPAEITGARLGDLVVRTDPHNIEFLTGFIQSGYRLENAESHEVDKEGHPKYFLNSFTGVVVDGNILRAWGVQRDISLQKLVEENLKVSEERFRLLAESVPTMVAA